MERKRAARLAALVVLCTAALAAAGAAATRLAVVGARGTVWLSVEVAATAAAQRRGLMDRTQLAADAGMLFVYAQQQPGDRAFWMYRTRIALDIAFLDADGRILAILTMEPCTHRLSWRCPRYAPGVPYWAALEVNRGFFARHGLRPGDRVRLPRAPS